MRCSLLLVTLTSMLGVLASINLAAQSAIDLTGTWVFSVDLDDGGGHGDPTFVFKQENGNLTGTYDGPLGQYKVTGTVKGDQAVFGFEFENGGQTRTATYTGHLESPTKMTGTIVLSGGPTGKWTAMKKP